MDFFEVHMVELSIGGILLWLLVNLIILNKTHNNAEALIDEAAKQHNWSEIEVLSHLRQMSIDTGIKKNEYFLTSILAVMLLFVYKLLV